MAILPKAFSVGGWLTGLTVTEKVLVMMLLLVPPSLTVTEMTVVPEALRVGMKVREPEVLGLV
jgi:hypothetical protein